LHAHRFSLRSGAKPQAAAIPLPGGRRAVATAATTVRRSQLQFPADLQFFSYGIKLLYSIMIKLFKIVNTEI
jgi:hypothetical protein